MNIKYVPIEISKYLNHKMMYSDASDPSCLPNGMNIVIQDKRFRYSNRIKYIMGMRFMIYGSASEFDNIVCNGQEIDLVEGSYTKIAFLGYSEYHAYNEKISFINANEEIINRRFHFNSLIDKLDTLYASEKDDNCIIAFYANTTSVIKVKYYISVIDLPFGVRKIRLPDNIEIHIAAITLCK